MMKETFEKSIFKYTLILALLYQLYQLTNGLVSGASTTLLNLVITVCLSIILFISWKVKNVNQLAFLFHLTMLPVMIYFWINFGGLSGSVPLILLAYTSWIIISLRSWQQLSILGTYLIVFIVLTEYPVLFGASNPNVVTLSVWQLSLDYLVIAIILTAFLLFLKNKFVTYRKGIEHRHVQLQKLSEIVRVQTDKLFYNQEEIKSINENLEKIIGDRIKNIAAKNQELEEYAFINAHLVRGPLCRILGLTNLMIQEENSPQLESIRKKAQYVDHVTRKINEITS